MTPSFGPRLAFTVRAWFRRPLRRMPGRGAVCIASVVRVGLPALAVLLLAGCQTGITPNAARSEATIRAYETRVVRLQGQVDAQRATLAALTPPPPTATPIPFAKLWRIELAGPVERRAAVGGGNGPTPVAARGDFLVAPIAVTNLTSNPLFFNPEQHLIAVDGDGRAYGLDPRAAGAAYLLDFGYEPSFAPRQPGVPYPDVLVFDVAATARDFTLQAKDESVVPRPRRAAAGRLHRRTCRAVSRRPVGPSLARRTGERG